MSYSSPWLNEDRLVSAHRPGRLAGRIPDLAANGTGRRPYNRHRHVPRPLAGRLELSIGVLLHAKDVYQRLSETGVNRCILAFVETPITKQLSLSHTPSASRQTPGCPRNTIINLTTKQLRQYYKLRCKKHTKSIQQST